MKQVNFEQFPIFCSMELLDHSSQSFLKQPNFYPQQLYPSLLLLKCKAEVVLQPLLSQNVYSIMLLDRILVNKKHNAP